MSETNQIKNIPLSKIRPNPDQPRKYFDAQAMDSLTRSIERYGVISPITVREYGDDEYELISGERRFRAAYKAGLTEIPCIIIRSGDSDCAILSLLENLQREDLPFLEIAQSYRDLVKKNGYTSHDVSRRLGDKPYKVKERISLMSLDPIVRKYIRSFKLTERQARALLKIKDSTAQIEAARQICENGLNEPETIKFIKELTKTDKDPSFHINKIKDIKIFRNTINKALNVLRMSGVEADYKEKTDENCEIFTITIHN